MIFLTLAMRICTGIAAMALCGLPASAQTITQSGDWGQIVTAIDSDFMVVYNDVTGRFAEAELLTGYKILEPSQAASDAGGVSMSLPPGEYTAIAFSIPPDRMDPNRDEVELALTVEDPEIANLQSVLARKNAALAWWRARYEAQRAMLARKSEGLNWWKARALAAEANGD